MGYFFSLSKSAASAGFDVSEWALLIFGLLLVVGIFGEYKKVPRWMMGPKPVFEAMVMIGVAGELLGDGGVFIFSRHLQAIEDRELSTLGSDAAQLEARVKLVGDEVTRAEASEKEAATGLAEAQYRLSPWNFDSAAQARTIAALRAFSGASPYGTPFALGADSHPYAFDLANKIDRVLASAGWDATALPGRSRPDSLKTARGTYVADVSSVGVTIEIPPAGTAATNRPPGRRLLDFKTPGIKLAEALNSEHIPASLKYLERKTGDSLTEGSVHVIVGRKP